MIPAPEAPDPDDPKGLIRESYRIDGITAAECRSILVDWALSIPAAGDASAAAERLHARHRADSDHPMTPLLTAASRAPARGSRRGGRAGHFDRTGRSSETR